MTPLNGKIKHISFYLLTEKIFYLLALMAHVFPQTGALHLRIALMAQCTILVPNKPRIGQFLGTQLTPETLRMPAGRHRLDHPTNDKFSALVAARCKQNVKVTFAVLATLKLVENAILEIPEALGAHKALCVPQLAVRVDDLFMCLESLVAAAANHRG
jgi:hypothetical protein